MEKGFSLLIRWISVFIIGLVIGNVANAQCPNPQHPDKAAILAFYNSLDGPNWPIANYQNWHYLANEIICDPCQLEGVQCLNDRVSEIVIENESALSGSLPTEIGNLSELRKLDLGTYDVTVDGVQGTFNFGNINGSIPSSIINLSNLEYLDLSANMITGTFPGGQGQLANLVHLNLSDNNISGFLPTLISNMPQLIVLSIHSNMFTGNIPEYIDNLTSLEHLNLSFNQLSGTIPSTIGNLSNLKDLDLYGCGLSGTIPLSIGDLALLESLHLSNNNLTGGIPTILGNLSMLLYLNISNNPLGGAIPTELTNLTAIEYLYLSNNSLIEEIPSAIGNMTSLIELSLNNNQLTDSIPSAITQVVSLDILRLQNNQFIGPLPEASTSSGLIIVDFSNNQITGEIPSSYEEITNGGGGLVVLSNNDLSGCIPMELLNLCGTVNFLLSNNSQLGTQQDFNSWCAAGGDPISFNPLSDLIVDAGIQPNLGGGIPTGGVYSGTGVTDNGDGTSFSFDPSIAGEGQVTITYTVTNVSCVKDATQTITVLPAVGCPDPQHPDKSAILAVYDSLNGPNWPVANFQNWHDLKSEVICDPCLLERVTCINNRVTSLSIFGRPEVSGVLPSEVGDLEFLQELVLSNNNLQGRIPIEVGNLTALTDLTLANNMLTGIIPSEIGNLTSLVYIFLMGNQLSGEIPSGIGNLTSLSHLHLQNNQLSGSIPAELGNLSGINQVFLTNNELGGCLPSNLQNLCGKDILLNNNVELGSQQDFVGWCSTGIIDVDNDGICVIEDCDDNDASVGSTVTFGPLSDVTNNAGLQYLGGGIPMGGVYSGTGVIDEGDGQEFQFDPSIPGDGTTIITYTVSACSQSATSSINVFTGSCPEPLHPDLAAMLALYDSLNGPNWPVAEFQNWHDLKNEVICDPCLTEGTLCPNNRVSRIRITNQPAVTGTLPPELGNLSSLRELFLNDNQISGPIPPELGNILVIDEIRLQNNQLSGTIPAELGGLNSMRGLSLQNNQLSGAIPPELGNPNSLRLLRLNLNQLSGELPPELGNLPLILTLDLSSNQLSGSIPPEFGNFSGIGTLYLNDNDLGGCLPANLQNLCLLLNTGGKVNLDANFNNNPQLGSQQDFANWCATGIIDADNDGLCVDIDCDDNDPNNGSTIAFANLADIEVDAGIQTNLGGGTPTGGVYSGTGVTDDGNGTTFTFDPSISGLGIITFTYTNVACSTNATSDINVIPGGCPDPQHPDKAAILALYDSLNGPNWPVADFQNWHDLKNEVICDPCLAEGVFCSNNRVVNIVIRDQVAVTGQIPSDIGALTRLTSIDLQRNRISGSIPSALGNISTLRIIRFSSNLITGEIPSELANLPLLTTLGLNNNQLSGEIPIEFGNMAAIQVIYLYNNEISGQLPASLGNSNTLQNLWVFNNNLSGEIPTEIGDMSLLQSLLLRNNNLEGCLPASMLNLCDKTVDLGNNPLLGLQQDFTTWCSSGQVDADNDGEGVFCDCDDNDPNNGSTIAITTLADVTVDAGIQTNLIGGSPTGGVYSGTGVTDDGNGTTFTFDPSIPGLGINTITYTNVACSTSATSDINVIPGGCPDPQHPDKAAILALYDSLNGPNWPVAEFQNWHDLKNEVICDPCLLEGITCVNDRIIRINLRNQPTISGTLPSAIGDLINLEQLVIDNCALSGPIPASIGNLTNLSVIDLRSNDVSGVLPLELSNLNQLRILELGGNNVTGSIPDWIGDFSLLEILILDSNEFSGSIPESIGNLTNLEALRAGSNNLSGTIPQTISNLSSLTVLYLRTNGLNGDIPPGIGNLPLTLLSLANNDLGGCLPADLSNLCARTVQIFSNPQLGDQQDFANWCATGIIDVDNDGLCANIDCDDNDPDNGSTIAFATLADVTVDAGIQTNLIGGTPTGGVYSGMGITDDGNGSTFTFDPSIPGLGINTITYTNVACSTSATSDITVLPICVVTITFTAPDDLCASEGIQTNLSGGLPIGGVYSGPGVTDDGNGQTYTFDPSIAGAGTVALSYFYDDGDACSISISDDVLIYGDIPPPVQFGLEPTICEGANQPPLLANAGTEATVDWYDALVGGTLLRSGISTGPNIWIAPAPGTYYAESRNVSTGCISSIRTPITLTINPQPTLTILDTECDVENDQYSITLLMDADSLTTTTGIINDLGSGSFIITGIPVTAAVNVRAINYSGCEASEVVESPECCDAVRPRFLSNEETCGDLPFPALTVSAESSTSIDWYDAPVDGTLLASGTTSYVPDAPGIYYAEYVESPDCISPTRTAVELVNISVDVTFLDLEDVAQNEGIQENLDGATPPGGIYGGPGVTDDGNGVTFTFDPTLLGTGMVYVTYTLTNTCADRDSSAISVLPLDCAFENNAPPIQIGQDATICEGENLPPLLADAGAASTVDWYDAPVGGTLLRSGVNTGPNIWIIPTPGTYYAESRDVTTGCTSDIRTPITLTVNTPPTLIVALTECEIEDGQYYIIVEAETDSLFTTTGIITDLNNGFYRIDDISDGVTVNIRAINYNGCEVSEVVEAPDCCNAVAPGFLSNQETCGDTPYPALTVSAGSMTSIDWYDAPVDGNLVATGTTSYVPSAPGVYYAELVVSPDCISPTRTAVELIDISVDVAFPELAEIELVDGVQIGLGGASPIGGIYSGLGVTDNGNGQTFNFDPSIAGEGLQTVTYTLQGTCMESASSAINVVGPPEQCAFIINDEINVVLPFGNSEIEICLTDNSIVTENIAILELNGEDVLENISGCEIGQFRGYALSDFFERSQEQGVPVTMQWEFGGQSYSNISVSSLEDVAEQMLIINPSGGWRLERRAESIQVVSGINSVDELEPYTLLSLNTNLINDDGSPFLGTTSPLFLRTVDTGINLALPLGMHEIIVGDDLGCLDTVFVNITSCDVVIEPICDDPENATCFEKTLEPGVTASLMADISIPEDCTGCMESFDIKFSESLEATYRVNLFKDGQLFYRGNRGTLSLTASVSENIPFSENLSITPGSTYTIDIEITKPIDSDAQTGTMELVSINSIDSGVDQDLDGAGVECDCNDEDNTVITTLDCDSCPPSEETQKDAVNRLLSSTKASPRVIRP